MSATRSTAVVQRWDGEGFLVPQRPLRGARSTPRRGGPGFREHCHRLNVYQCWRAAGFVRSLGGSTGATADIRRADARHRPSAGFGRISAAGPAVGRPRASRLDGPGYRFRAGRCRASPWMAGPVPVPRAARRRAGGQQQAVPIGDVPEQGGEIAAVADDGRGKFSPQRVARHDPEVATDIGENGASRAAADLGRDVPGRRQTGDAWIVRGGAAVLGLGGARLARGWGGQGVAGSRTGRLISLASSAAARSRPRVMRARICPMSTMPKCRVMSARSVAEARCCSAAARYRP